ncbi:cytochrome b/b6 domain-containing protein [Streptomyces montanus]|uniref:cytochrome b/b6 domain-containing protein n=1 Tax=Streptomyces montanus TaxID=2580423 RepID=UPI0014866E23|nr:cytochrome b/b6 domain-containing protein [Streptomyces montanus]
MKPRSKNSSVPQPGRSVTGGITAAALLLIPVVVLVGGDTVREFLNFGAGVLSLVSLSASVIWGLVASDQIFLKARQRLLAQAVHRSTAVASLLFLLLHITVKLALGHVGALALIPFGLGVSGQEALIGIGAAAGLMMIITGLTGALRSAFASPVQVAARWRAVHMLAYPAWCAALIHGLFAGRQAKPIFVILYGLSLVAVMGALALRASPQPFRRNVARRILGMLETDNNRPLREEPPARRAMADSRLPGSGSRSGFQEPFVPQQRTSSPSSPLYDTGQRSALTDTGQRSALTDTGASALTDTGGFAAAYRAVSNTPRGADPMQPQQAQNGQLPFEMQPTESLPRVDDNTAARWPTPSPTLYEAPPRPAETPTTYNPAYDTNAGGMSYGTPPNPSYGSSDLYDTGETIDPLGTYYTNDQYDSGPATETLPGAYEAPSSGEPWNAPSGGF